MKKTSEDGYKERKDIIIDYHKFLDEMERLLSPGKEKKKDSGGGFDLGYNNTAQEIEAKKNAVRTIAKKQNKRVKSMEEEIKNLKSFLPETDFLRK
jgi:hypothetical protein